MSKLRYAPQLLKEGARFAWDRKVYWILPLFLLLVLAAFLIFGGQSAAPFIYALF